MNRSRIFWAVVAAVAAGSFAPSAFAVDPPDLFPAQLKDFIWTGAGDGTTWDSAPNWTPPSGPEFIGQYPDDPNRLDDDGDANNNADLVDLKPVEGANFSVPRATDLTVNIANGNVTVAALKLGGTTSAVTTAINATGANRLVMELAERNDTSVTTVTNYTYNQGNALIWSTGTDGVGKVNRINADMQLNDTVDVEGDRELHIYGNIYEGVPDRNTGDAINEVLASSINNLLQNGKRLYIHGNINLLENDGDPNAAGIQERSFGINRQRGTLEANPAPMPAPTPVARWGTVDISGQISNAGNSYLAIGPEDAGQANLVPISTVILRGNNSGFTGRLVQGRANIALGNDNALGVGGALTSNNVIVTGNPSQGFGFNFVPVGGDRTIALPLQIAQWQTVKGANSVAELKDEFDDQNITFSGEVVQTNTRGWVNTLPEGKTLTLSGPQYPNKKSENPPDQAGRWYTIDGSGKTVITGGIYDQYDDNAPGVRNFTGNLRVRGSGTVVVDWVDRGMIPNPKYDPTGHPAEPLQIVDHASDFHGYVSVEGGNLHFAQNEDLPDAPSIFPANYQMISVSGAVGVDSGTVGNATFLGMFNNSAVPMVAKAASDAIIAPFFRNFGDETNTQPIFNNYDHGGLMLAAGEYGSSLDFSAGALLNLANMSLAARDGGSTFTGTIKPAPFQLNALASTNTGVAVEADTVKLGGGNGKLTLNGTNQIVGTTSKLMITNGGEVAITGTHNFTGAVKVIGVAVNSVEDLAKGDASGLQGVANNAVFDGPVVYRGSQLTVTNLANGGANSGVGASTNAASNLTIQGSVLKYVGAAQSTDRLFTIGTRGATIDASGGGALQFTNSGAVGVDSAESRAATLGNVSGDSTYNEVFGIPTVTNGTIGGVVLNQQNLFSTEDLVVGMQISNVPTTTGGDNGTGDTGLFPQSVGGSTALGDDDSPLVITEIMSPNAVRVGETDLTADTVNGAAPNEWTGYGSLSRSSRKILFGAAPARFLTLTGSNSGNNSISSTIGNEAAPTLALTAAEITAGFGTVGINKTGTGKWVLSANNTYGGATNVQDGTLLINGTQTGGGAYNVTATETAKGTLGGTGSITGALSAIGFSAAQRATVAPGASIGTLTVTGNVTLGDFSNLAIELSGASAADKLAISGNLDLSSLTNALSLTGSCTGVCTIATYGGMLTGVFDTVTAGYSIDYSTVGVIKLMGAAAGLPGDYNNDHVVNALDYTVWRNNLGDATEADLNNNGDGGNVGPTDFDWWKSHYGTTSPGGGGLAAVPEPASLLLVALAVGSLFGCGRRHR